MSLLIQERLRYDLSFPTSPVGRGAVIRTTTVEVGLQLPLSHCRAELQRLRSLARARLGRRWARKFVLSFKQLRRRKARRAGQVI